MVIYIESQENILLGTGCEYTQGHGFDFQGSPEFDALVLHVHVI